MSLNRALELFVQDYWRVHVWRLCKINHLVSFLPWSRISDTDIRERQNHWQELQVFITFSISIPDNGRLLFMKLIEIPDASILSKHSSATEICDSHRNVLYIDVLHFAATTFVLAHNVLFFVMGVIWNTELL